jgi:hypothetical protein
MQALKSSEVQQFRLRSLGNYFFSSVPKLRLNLLNHRQIAVQFFR